jgi:hypothetical protein
MTLTNTDREALRAAISNLERLVEALKTRSGPPNPDEERSECRDRLRIVNPELTALRLQLNDLDAADVVVAPPSPDDVQRINTALVALGQHVAADQNWDAFCTAADKILATAQELRTNVTGRKT